MGKLKRRRSKNKPKKKRALSIPKHIPEKLHKYYIQRHTLWSKIDQDVWMDEESWYSVTPEEIAKSVAERCKNFSIVLDAFCGGSCVQFAKKVDLVIALDIDPVKLACAAHNAEIYGVRHKIEFIQADFMKIYKTFINKVDIVHIAPPWGGPEYINCEAFDIETMIPMNGRRVFECAHEITKNVIYQLPRNAIFDQIASLVGPDEFFEVEENYTKDKVKMLHVYFGDLVRLNEENLE